MGVNNIQQQHNMQKFYTSSLNPSRQSKKTPSPTPSSSYPHPNQPYRLQSQPVPQSQPLSQSRHQWPHTETHTLNSIEIDYRQKAFQLMRKNTELQLNMRQAKLDVEGLEREMDRFQGIVGEIVDVIGGREGAGWGFLGERAEGYTVQDDLEYIKKCLHGKFGQKHNQLQYSRVTQHAKKQPYSSSFQSTYKNLDTQRTAHKASTNTYPDQSLYEPQPFLQPSPTPSPSPQCECESHYTAILAQYKEMLNSQHSNIMKKDKSNKLLRKEVQEYKLVIQELKRNCGRLMGEVGELEGRVGQLEGDRKGLEDRVRGYEIMEGKGKESEAMIGQLEKKLREQTEQAESKLAEKDRQLQNILKEREQLFRQKQKLKHKYKQQIVHFEQMQKLVEQKLIEVEYEMNFYKKEREQNFEKIRRLENELREYKAEEEKKYYSFGERLREVGVQVQGDELGPEVVVSQAEIIIGCDRSVTVRKRDGGQEREKEKGREEDMPELQVIEAKKSAKDMWQVECYQQSIKTLLLENARLKNSLLKLYKGRSSPQTSQLDQQLQIQLKMLLSTINEAPAEQEQYETEPEIVQQVRKGRKFIKEV